VAPDPVEPLKVLRRADLIALAHQVSDALASNRAMPATVASLAGQRFELFVPFGCSGPSAETGSQPMGWRYDAANSTLRISVTPVTWAADQWRVGSTMGTPAEGFWIARPWSSSEQCPASGVQPGPAGADPVTLPEHTLAIAQFSTAERSALFRDGKPLELVKRVPPDMLNMSQGLRLRIIGRIDREFGPVRCVQPAGAEQRPLCVISARIDEMMIENPVSDELLGSWSTR